MTKKPIRKLSLLVGLAVLLTAAGAALAGSQAPPPAGEPTLPGVSYADGKGAPYLSSKGAPRKLSGFGIGQLGGALQAAAEKAGIKAAAKAGPKVKPLDLTVGYLDIIGGIESADRIHNALRVAFSRIGAKWKYCDGAGNPQKWVTCGNSLIAQGVDVIALSGIDPSTIPTVVQAAKDKGIAIVGAGGLVGPGYSAVFAPNEKRAGILLSRYLKAKLAGQPGTSNILLIDYPAPWATDRSNRLKEMVASTPSLKISLTATTDPTNLVAGTEKTINDQLTADPTLKAVWVDFDTAGAVAGKAVATRYPGKKFPDKPLVVTFHADPSTQLLMQQGAVDAVLDYNYDISAWMVVDAVAEYFARKTPWPAYSVTKRYPGIGDPTSYQIVTGKNLPPAGKYTAPLVDGVSFFIAKWKAEGFGK
jgi:ABC-type sugar transport system substrate-binding protein